MNPGNDPKTLEKLWKSAQSWKWGNIYFCKEDPRVIVPKRLKWMGWTINFARPSAFPTLFALMVFIGLPFFWLAFTGFANAPLWFAIIVADILALCLICWYLASKKRY